MHTTYPIIGRVCHTLNSTGLVSVLYLYIKTCARLKNWLIIPLRNNLYPRKIPIWTYIPWQGCQYKGVWMKLVLQTEWTLKQDPTTTRNIFEGFIK